MRYSLVYGEAFRDDEADPSGGRIRVYELGDGSRYVGHDTHDIAHVCSSGCLASWEAELGDDWRVTRLGGAYVSTQTDTRPPFTYAQTIDAQSFDPGGDEYILCAQCGDVMVDEREAPEDMVRAYVACLLWASTITPSEDADPIPAEDVWDVDEILASSIAEEIREDVNSFYRANANVWSEAGWTDEEAGHDFMLTRDGHGAGFWDRGRGEAGDKLTEACRPYGNGSDVLYQLELPAWIAD